MRVFVTGATGFAGSWLVDSLLADGDEVWAMTRKAAGHSAFFDRPNIHRVCANLLDTETVSEQICAARPDIIYHLAGQPYPGRSWQIPQETFALNVSGVATVLDAAVKANKPRVVVVTSADIYGKVRPKQLPLTEKSKPKPRHPYGISKMAAGALVHVYAQRYGLPVVEARPFNHIGTRQSLGFVVPDFASQIVGIRLGLKEPHMMVGNLSAERDFTDVRDVVRAYRAVAEHGRPGRAYLICSGQPVSIQTILNILLEMNNVSPQIEHDPARMRPSDVPILYGSSARLQQETGWSPQHPLRDTLQNVVVEWEKKLLLK